MGGLIVLWEEFRYNEDVNYRYWSKEAFLWVKKYSQPMN